MSFVIGRGRYARATYPAGANAALVALSNRYLISPSGPGTPSPFTVASPTTHTVAAVNVVRRASGIFMVAVQMPVQLAAADQIGWSASVLFGATATGGVANGQWLLDIAAPISISGAIGGTVASVDVSQSGAGNLIRTVTLTGANAAPAPQGPIAIIITGTTIGGTQITPSLFYGTAYELP